MQVSFEDRDITKHPSAVKELRRLGYMTTPVLVIDESVVVGFDQAKIDTALQKRAGSSVCSVAFPAAKTRGTRTVQVDSVPSSS